nr:TlpA disulfide reductase family protein [uncultured Prevotella sp.]
MQKIIYLFCLIFSVSIVSAQEICHITVEYPNWGDTLLVNTTECITGKTQEDTVLTNNGKFCYDMVLKAPAIMNICTPAAIEDRSAEAASQIERFVIVAGDTMICKGYKEIEGTLFFRQYAKARKFIKSPDYRNSESKYKAIVDYIKNNKSDEACVALITDYSVSPVMNEEKMKEAFALLSSDVQNGRMRPLFDFMMDRIKTKQEKKIKETTSIGELAKDFILKDIDGKDVQLSAFRGLYVLLDFWGSWCTPCMRDILKLKEFYEKNKGKLVVIGINCQDVETRWKKAVKANQMTWHNVFAPKNGQVEKDYSIHAYPTKILISPDGYILNFSSNAYSDIYSYTQDILDRTNISSKQY